MALTELFDKARHCRDAFDCGQDSLNNYLRFQTSKESKLGLAQIHVHADGEGNVLGYFTLSSSELPRDSVPEELQRKLPSGYAGYPAILIGRLAVNKLQQGTGLGGELLVEAIEKCVLHAETIGTRAIIVDPINEAAAAFYGRFMFRTLPDSSRMVLHIDHNLQEHFGL
jgi:GNAT superfamily N-acetyltransferase